MDVDGQRCVRKHGNVDRLSLTVMMVTSLYWWLIVGDDLLMWLIEDVADQNSWNRHLMLVTNKFCLQHPSRRSLMLYQFNGDFESIGFIDFLDFLIYHYRLIDDKLSLRKIEKKEWRISIIKSYPRPDMNSFWWFVTLELMSNSYIFFEKNWSHASVTCIP